MKTVYLPGVWDCLHGGHLNAIRHAKAMGDRLVVGVVSDAGAAAYKRMPLFTESHRLAVVSALKNVDLAILQLTTDPTRELEVIRPDILCHGSDWARLKEGHETLERLGIEYRSFPYTDGISTTSILSSNGLI